MLCRTRHKAQCKHRMQPIVSHRRPKVNTHLKWWGKTKKSEFDIKWAKRVSAYCAVRYGACNSLWCLSGEYQYTFRDCHWTEESLNDLRRTVQSHNPNHHPLSIHPSARLDWLPPHNCQSSRLFHRSGCLDHNWLQTGQSIDRMHNIVSRAAENRSLAPSRPVVWASRRRSW